MRGEAGGAISCDGGGGGIAVAAAWAAASEPARMAAAVKGRAKQWPMALRARGVCERYPCQCERYPRQITASPSPDVAAAGRGFG